MAKKTKATKAEAKNEPQANATPPAPVATTLVPAAEPTPVETKAEPRGSNVRVAKSTVASPVKVVHQLVADMVKANPNVRRKDLVEAAIKAGVAYFTARTQVQVALTVQKSGSCASQDIADDRLMGRR
jgi:hypothetical protein